jgi:hypothetical protein
VAVSPRAAPWLVAVGSAVWTRACGIKSPPDRPLSEDVARCRRRPRLASRAPVPTARYPVSVPLRQPADASSPRPPRRCSDCVGPKSSSPPFGKPRRRTVRRRPRASPHAPAPPPPSDASPGVKPPCCPRPPPCPRLDSRVHRFLPASPPGSPSLPSQLCYRRVPSPPKVPLPLSVPECAAAVGAVRLGRLRHRAVPSLWARAHRAPWRSVQR